jgi:hypothetical protein
MAWHYFARPADSRPGRIVQFGAAVAAVVLLTLAVVPCFCQSVNQSDARESKHIDAASLNFYSKAHPYLEEPLKSLIKHIPELKTIRPAPDQELLPIILMHTGMRVSEFFDNVVDLSAHEEVAQEILSLEGTRFASHNSFTTII